MVSYTNDRPGTPWTPPAPAPRQTTYAGAMPPVPAGGTFAKQVAEWYRQYLGREATPQEIQSHAGNPGGMPAVLQLIQQAVPQTPTPPAPSGNAGDSQIPGWGWNTEPQEGFYWKNGVLYFGGGVTGQGSGPVPRREGDGFPPNRTNPNQPTDSTGQKSPLVNDPMPKVIDDLPIRKPIAPGQGPTIPNNPNLPPGLAQPFTTSQYATTLGASMPSTLGRVPMTVAQTRPVAPRTQAQPINAIPLKDVMSSYARMKTATGQTMSTPASQQARYTALGGRYL